MLALAAFATAAAAAEKTSPRSRPKPAGNGKGPRETTFDDIKLNLAKNELFTRSMLTPEIEALDKKRIRIRGYIFPTTIESGITQFVLVRDNLECCFGPGAALHDCIWVTMKEGNTANYTVAPVAVEGTFRIEEILDPDGKQVAIYQLDGEKVK